jgi:hypothetical protein
MASFAALALIYFADRCCGYDARMRRFLIGLTLALLLTVSISIGVTVARWPHCRQLCPWICARGPV